MTATDSLKTLLSAGFLVLFVSILIMAFVEAIRYAVITRLLDLPDDYD